MTALYAVLKLAVYSGWCYVGLRLFDPSGSRRVLKALGWGVVRALMGLGFGIGIWLLATLAAGLLTRNQLLIYLLVYVPVRWVEWGIVERGLHGGGSFREFALGTDASRGWRARGIVLSCLADIPVIVSMGGLPLGRFMC